MSADCESVEWRLKEAEKTVESHDHLLRGNGKKGLVTEVAELKQSVGGIMKLLWIIIGIGISTLAAIVMHTGK